MKAIKVSVFILFSVAAIFVINLSSGRPEPAPSEAMLMPEPDETPRDTFEIVAYPGSLVTETSRAPKLADFPKKGIPVLMYHSISDVPGNTLCVTEEQFREELGWLSENNYYALGIEEFAKALTGGESVPENSILITFDDGYLDNYTAAQPLLEEYGLRATFFIITGSVGAPGYLNWSQIWDLIRRGGSVGSHTVAHRDLRTLSDIRQEGELLDSKKQLEEKLGIKVIAFCYPSGQYNKTTLDLLPGAGYSLAFTTKSGRVKRNDDRLELRRIRVWGGMSLEAFIKQVSYK